MGKINLARVIIAGLLAGLVINIGEFILNGAILKQQWADQLEKHKVPPMGGGIQMAYFIAISFAIGLVMIWVYAAIRPRLGAGPKTAICAGLVTWALAYLLPSASEVAMHLFSRRLLLYGTVWGLFELPIAALIGAWLYKETA
jgi:hypothetical protein